MKQWSIAGSPYDRPIPRRIVEQAGVPRAMFGARKQAVARPYQTTGNFNPPLDKVFSKNAFADFKAWQKNEAFGFRSTTVLRHAVLHRLYSRLARTKGFWRLASLAARYRKTISEHNFVFLWATTRMRHRYEKALKHSH
jgi:hypothetical protein